MKLYPVSYSVFRGKHVWYDYCSAGMNGIKQLNEYYSNSKIEKIIGEGHNIPKNFIYFASPNESVSQALKQTVDYVVYDMAPEYPDLEDIRKNYFETNRTNYRKIFENIRDYHYRSEIGGFTDSNEAKYQQWQAAECIRLYDKAGDLRYKKEKAEDELKNIHIEQSNISMGISNTKKEIEKQMQLKMALEIHIKNLKKIATDGGKEDFSKTAALTNENVLYSFAEVRVNDEMRNLPQYYNGNGNSYPYSVNKYGKYINTVRVYDSIKTKMEESYCIGMPKGNVNNNRLSLRETIIAFENILKENGLVIEEMNSYVSELQSKLKTIEQELPLKKTYINKCKEELTPLFNEFQNYYLKQCIKMIKK